MIARRRRENAASQARAPGNVRAGLPKEKRPRSAVRIRRRSEASAPNARDREELGDVEILRGSRHRTQPVAASRPFGRYGQNDRLDRADAVAAGFKEVLERPPREKPDVR